MCKIESAHHKFVKLQGLSSTYALWLVAMIAAVFNGSCLIWLMIRSFSQNSDRQPREHHKRPLLEERSPSPSRLVYAGWRRGNRSKRGLYLSDIEGCDCDCGYRNGSGTRLSMISDEWELRHSRGFHSV